ncbi:enolase C-terminal domain-like protein [Macrococcus lamae]|uniref:Enolase C-terminal domain-containing protein n=1 Tax=Macrococcus lamae TaxID=198484 RepID=A0A4R6BTI5_9STAP|nr:enolase C-terminal domain-like protein [Macrococcus lamae]TDM07493.1 hypothetical protein ERX29_08645 [Macrococcus lamae]
MKFNNLKCYKFNAPFKTPIQTVKTRLTDRRVLVISLDVDDRTYFAESNAFDTNWYHDETIATVHAAVQHIFSEISETEWHDYAELGTLLASYRSTPHTIALFDYIGWQCTNELNPVTVPLGFTLHQGHTGEFSNRVKVKWNAHIESQVKALRQQYPEIKIAIDANGSLTEADVPILEACMNYEIDYFEEPFSDIRLYSKYHRLPLAIDESASSIEQIIKYYGAGVKTIIAKYSRLGGGYPLLTIKDAIPDIRIIAGGMYEYGLSKYFTAALAEQLGTIPDITPRGFYFDGDYADWNEKIQDGQLTMSFPQVNEQRLIPLNK